MIVKDLNAANVIRIPVSADEGADATPTTQSSSEISENAIAVVFGDIAIYYQFSSICALNHRHVPLTNINEVYNCAHSPAYNAQFANR